MSNIEKIKASECKCCMCGEQAVAFWPCIDPDIPSRPYCRKCLNKAKMKALVDMFGYKGLDVTDFCKPIDPDIAQCIADNFWEMAGEPVSKDLEEAAKEYADKHGFRVPYDGSNNYYDDVDVKASKDGFIAGAEWGKKAMRDQMIEDAVDGEIVKDISNMLAVTARNIHLDGFKFGDKVKIIIVKK